MPTGARRIRRVRRVGGRVRRNCSTRRMQTWMQTSVANLRVFVPVICCSWCRGSGWSRSVCPSACWRLARLLQQPDLTGSHEGAPDGFLLAYGREVAHADLRRGSIVDLAPTVLYYLGVPVGRDMDGYARTDLFVPAYRRQHPVTFISTHEK